MCRHGRIIIYTYSYSTRSLSAPIVFTWLLSNDHNYNYNNDTLCLSMANCSSCCSCGIVSTRTTILCVLTTIPVSHTIRFCSTYIHNAAFKNTGISKAKISDIAREMFAQWHLKVALSRRLAKSLFNTTMQKQKRGQAADSQVSYRYMYIVIYPTNSHLPNGPKIRRKSGCQPSI